MLGDSRVADTVSAVAWALPLGSIMLVGLAATRGFGGVLPFNLVGNIGVPLSRPVAVLAVTALGGSVIAAALAWVLPLVPAVLVEPLGAVAPGHRLRARARRCAGRLLPTRAVQRRLLGFALPRTMSSALEQSIIWFDVVLVGVIAGAADAGIYGAASRFVGAGVIVLTALRIVVAPRFSAYLAQERHDEVQQLYTRHRELDPAVRRPHLRPARVLLADRARLARPRLRSRGVLAWWCSAWARCSCSRAATSSRCC